MQAQFDTTAGSEVVTLARCEGYGVLGQPGAAAETWYTGLESDTTVVGLAQMTRMAQVAGQEVATDDGAHDARVWDRVLSLLRN